MAHLVYLAAVTCISICACLLSAVTLAQTIDYGRVTTEQLLADFGAKLGDSSQYLSASECRQEHDLFPIVNTLVEGQNGLVTLMNDPNDTLLPVAMNIALAILVGAIALVIINLVLNILTFYRFWAATRPGSVAFVAASETESTIAMAPILQNDVKIRGPIIIPTSTTEPVSPTSYSTINGSNGGLNNGLPPSRGTVNSSSQKVSGEYDDSIEDAEDDDRMRRHRNGERLPEADKLLSNSKNGRSYADNTPVRQSDGNL